MSDALLAALRERPAFAALTVDDLKPLPATGTAHGHVRLPNSLLARVAYAHEGDPTTAARLQAQAEAFCHLARAGRTPRLHDVLEPRPGLPGGALIVDCIEGRAPRLADDLGAIADTLARIHSLPLPAASSPIPRQKNPFTETLEAIEQNAMRFLDKAVPDSGARAEIAEELRLMRGMALAFAKRPQPLTVARPTPIPATSSSIGRGSPGSSISRKCMSARRRSTSRMQRLRPRRSGIPMSAKCCHVSRRRASTIYILRRSERNRRRPCSRGSPRCAG